MLQLRNPLRVCLSQVNCCGRFACKNNKKNASNLLGNNRFETIPDSWQLQMIEIYHGFNELSFYILSLFQFEPII